MKRSKPLIKSIFAIVLTLITAMACFPVPASANVVTVTDPEQKLQYLYTFNDSVNAIKEKKPSFKYKKTSGMNQSDEAYDYSISSKTAADLSDEARKYLTVIVDAFFDPQKGLVKNFIGALMDTSSPVTEKDIIKGTDTTYFLPLYGEGYLSALTVDDEYTLRTEAVTDILNPENNSLTVRYEFDDTDLEGAKTSSHSKVFDLPSGSIDPVIISGGKLTDSEGPLSEVKFDDFTFDDAYVQAQYNSKNELVNYTQHISYTFKLTFYDMIRVFGAYTDIDLMEIALAIANPILSNTGKPEVTARDVLTDYTIEIRYDITMELSDFDWNPRYFGDVDNNGKIDAYDARSVLRNSVGLEQFKNDESLVYADVDFDGKITASDARHVLRTSVGLEQSFSEVPEGESIKIVVTLPPVEQPEQPEQPENPEEPENPENPEDPENPGTGGGIQLPSTGEVAGSISEFINAIFDIINGFKGEGTSDSEISSIIQMVKDIIANAKDDITDDNEGEGGVIVVPDTSNNP